MPFSGLSGQYGGIANSVIRSKYEVTNVYENPETTEEYFRGVLRDIRPDEPFMESDQTRRDNHSEERLSLRFSAHRTGEIPDHSEAFLELTERDPRGTALDPNFREAYKQGSYRMRYVKMYPDDDMSVTEREKRPQQLVTQIREQQEGIANRLKIFSTSKDSYAAARNFKSAPDSHETVDASVMPGAASEQRATTYTNWTTAASNTWPVGWTSTTDNEFEVARYGNVYRAAQIGDAAANRHDFDTEMNPYMTTFQDQRVSVGIARLMRAVMQEKIQNGEWAFQVENQALPSASASFRDPSRMRETMHEVARQARFRDAATVAGAPRANQDAAVRRASTVSLRDVETMMMASRATSKRQQRALQETLLSSRAQPTGAEQRPGPALAARAKVGRAHTSTQQWIEGLQTADLSQKRASKGDSRRTAGGEPYAKASTQTAGPTGQTPKRRTTSRTESQSHSSFATHSQLRAPLGSKYTRESADTTVQHNSVNDR